MVAHLGKEDGGPLKIFATVYDSTGRMRSGCCMVAEDASETGANGIAGTADAVI